MTVDRNLDQLTSAGEASDRLEALRALAETEESSETVVRALLDARDSDPDAAVREEAARILRSPAHQALMRRSIVLSMRSAVPADASGALFFEAWEEIAPGGSDSIRWLVEISPGEALFRREGTDDCVAVPTANAAAVVEINPEIGPPEAEGRTAPRRRIRVQDHTLNLSPTAYLKLCEWMEKAAEPAATRRGRRAVPRIAWVLLAAGAIQLALSATLSPIWGAACILLGAANLFAPPRKLDLVNAIMVLMAGVWYVLFAGPGLNLLGYVPGVWGSLRVFEFIRGR